MRFERELECKWDGCKKRREKKGEVSWEFSNFARWEICLDEGGNFNEKEWAIIKETMSVQLIFSFLRFLRVSTIDALFRVNFLWGIYVLRICVYVCMYVVEQRVYLSFKGVQTRTQHREHFMRAFWNVKDFNLDTRREARKTNRCDWRVHAQCS